MPFVALSTGGSESDYENMCEILNAVPEIRYICIDFVNGYSQSFVEHVKKVRANYPSHTIIAGNVVTAKMLKSSSYLELTLLKLVLAQDQCAPLERRPVLATHKLVVFWNVLKQHMDLGDMLSPMVVVPVPVTLVKLLPLELILS